MPSIPDTRPPVKSGGKDWTPVTASDPCPACKKPDRCKFAPDRGRVMCFREKSDKPVTGGVAWYHDLGPPRAAGSDKESKPPVDFAALAARYAAALTDDHKAQLAQSLGLSVAALAALPQIGFHAGHPVGECYTFPEVDAAEKVIGITLRFVDPDKGKMAVKGSRRGLTISAGWRDLPGPLLLCEGASDVLALSRVGLACVGRPSATGGVDLLARLLTRVPVHREIVVLGENW